MILVPPGLPREAKKCRFPGVRAGLQNRNARFDSWVPRYEKWLYSARSSAVEPNSSVTRSGLDPHRSPRICSRQRISFHRTFHWPVLAAHRRRAA